MKDKIANDVLEIEELSERALSLSQEFNEAIRELNSKLSALKEKTGIDAKVGITISEE